MHSSRSAQSRLSVDQDLSAQVDENFRSMNASDLKPDDLLSSLIERYNTFGVPVEVNFRNLVAIRPGEDRLTHLIHSYPAKLIPNIPSFFINCRHLAADDALVYDPFCGTGTVLVEAVASKKRTAGADANPLARMIARVKTTALNETELNDDFSKVIAIVPRMKPSGFAPVVSEEKWFTSESSEWLGKIRGSIEKVAAGSNREFLLICLSQIVKKCSLADPRLSVPVLSKDPDRNIFHPFEAFKKTCLQNMSRVGTLPNPCRPLAIGEDARSRLEHPAGTSHLADLVITSPPYAGAQKYIRASSLSLGWLDLVPEAKLRNLEKLNIGREHLTAKDSVLDYTCLAPEVQSEISRISKLNQSRAGIFGTYMREMEDAASAIKLSLKVGGYLVLVMGDNQIAGSPVRTSIHVRNLFISKGFVVVAEMIDHIKSRGLMTKRNKTAGIISHEYVFIMRRSQ